MGRTSAGLLMYRLRHGSPEVLLVHPGGPLYARRDAGAWTIPKGEPDPGEDLLVSAVREFEEETGFASAPPYHALGEVRQRGGKTVHAWAFAGDVDPADLCSNDFTMEWPPGSGRRASFPEVDRGAFLTAEAARRVIHPAQEPFLDRLLALLAD